MIEKQILLSDARVSDRIRREYEVFGVEMTATGIVQHVDSEKVYVGNSEDDSLRWFFDDYAEATTFYLVHRPAPPLPTEPGSRIKVTKIIFDTGEWLARLGANGTWSLFDLTREADVLWAAPHHIEEWHHIEIFEVTP
ncbi:hypothetical protein GCM10009861_02310 [Neomicrococcus aestuarii]